MSPVGLTLFSRTAELQITGGGHMKKLHSSRRTSCFVSAPLANIWSAASTACSFFACSFQSSESSQMFSSCMSEVLNCIPHAFQHPWVHFQPSSFDSGSNETKWSRVRSCGVVALQGLIEIKMRKSFYDKGVLQTLLDHVHTTCVRAFVCGQCGVRAPYHSITRTP